MTTVLIADDHPLVRNAVSNLLRPDRAFEVVGQVGSFPELWTALEVETPDLVLLDVKMPGGDGVEAVSRLRRDCPDTAVLILSGFPEEEFVVRLIHAGAAGYVEKQSSPDVLREAIHRVAAGGVYVGPAGAAALARAVGPTGSAKDHELLSDRELQVLRLIGEGLAVGDIARELHLSPKTISTYRSRLMEKMGLESTAEIIRYAVRNGLIE